MSETGVVLVTGVGRLRGIGAAIARGLAQDGWDLALSYWHEYDDRLGYPHGDDDPLRLTEEAARPRGTGRADPRRPGRPGGA